LFNASFSTTSILFFILVTGLLLFSGTTLHPQVGLSQKNESGMVTSSDDLPAVTMDSCKAAVGKPIDMLFIAACLILAPSVFKSIGGTLYGVDEQVGPEEGVIPFKSKSDDVDSTSGDDGTSTDRSNDDSTSDSLDHNSDDGPSD
jgi:hypothetical protein